MRPPESHSSIYYRARALTHTRTHTQLCQVISFSQDSRIKLRINFSPVSCTGPHVHLALFKPIRLVKKNYEAPDCEIALIHFLLLLS